MKILITNDDGIKAPGIHTLAQIASNYGEVYIVAPHTNNSAVGHGITMRRPLKSYPDSIKGATLAIGVDGNTALGLGARAPREEIRLAGHLVLHLAHHGIL